jgi:hypothetical protein
VAIQLLVNCTELVSKYQKDSVAFADLQYETFNNIARCFNNDGNIEESLVYLLKAMDNINIHARSQEKGSDAVVAELSLNIANAHIYLGNLYDALEFAGIAIKSSIECVRSLDKKLVSPEGASPGAKAAEKDRLLQS